MSLESQRQGLFIMVSRKRERSPRSEREESPLLAPPTPPATDKRRRNVDDEEVDWDAQMRELGNSHAFESVQEPAKRSHHQLWWAHDTSLLVVHPDSNCSSNFDEEDCSSHAPFTTSTLDLSSEESYNIGTRSGILALSREDLDAIAYAAPSVTPSHIVSERSHDSNSVIAQQDPATRRVQIGDAEDEGSSNFPGDRRHHYAVEEKSVGSSPQL